MIEQVPFMLKGRNPDVLTCIANLSNDEVFTPPEFANRMLDTLAEAWAESHNGANIWSDKTVTFLDPCAKSGIFLREITSRLTKGLKEEIPDLQERVDHILTKQVFGIGITSITSLLARRSLYCSKQANGEHSIARSFGSDEGNVWFERIEHTWAGNKCEFCGADRKTFDRGEDRETHAYAFIHTDNIKARIAELFGNNMQFDVIIGNPPYQLEDGGAGASAVPIYNKFVDQAKALEPRLISMVIPSRWFFGGRGLDNFRRAMLSDRSMRKLIDFPDSREVFQGVDVAGGICYFLWDRDNSGDCSVVAHEPGQAPDEVVRPLIEPGTDIFIRSNKALPILKKVMAFENGSGSSDLRLPEDKRFDVQVSSQKPFGLRTFFRGVDKKSSKNDLLVLQSRGRAWTSRDQISAGQDLIDKWKVFTSKSSSEHAGQVDKNGQRRVLSLSGVIPPGSVVTETYVLLGAFDSEEEARNCFSYVTTKFFRFLIAVRSSAQDLARSAYSFVPLQDFSKPWNDKKLFKKYGISKDEISYIESKIRPMNPDNG
ncbi:Eco57I restriction-modification methylase domain-containing protein [Pelagicoccus sp. SDUM812002]|uniref:Eco57I restriction-modification methylase domain-containing protein n=1 Tax=Pelagicoccus sp. SDUM812002 TaxID=3041266 RepID=UPI00280ED642|nr:Eco57I restriction-modification methylase domain-containing protein [Pelagicoccus sp. SDUM812002]MDQ8184288.1 Eco57I restriction-modification methylase domain-containing protein [Pelagicoccus sp. SDUM812002]